MLRYHWLVAMFALLAGVYLTTIACGGAADATDQTGESEGEENEGKYPP